MTKIKLSQYFN